ncbi:MAG: adenylate/guanylate cyclase domain-containing protein, partial [Spirochaetes bacterium]|nr:adenylate/guanylate cyclase domain-containing protein [Spirochaetota bacterium]
MPPSVIAVVNAYPRFDAVFDPVALEMRMFVKKYPGIRPMADDLNAKILPPEDLALIICTGTSEENDAAQYRQNMGLLGQLAKHSKLKSVPVLFLGYKGDNYLLDACEGCGAAYLDLPVRKGALIGKIRALCEVTPLQGGRGDGGSPTPALPLNKGEGAEGGRGMSAAESERRLATVMFADISGFTAMSEKMDPEEVTGIMNGVFREMETVIKGHGGTIDKFIGDCVMVLFGVPTAIENAPLRAVNTAIEMRNRLYQFNKDNNLAIPLDIHIGVNTGPVVAGHVGGADKKDYTVMGDAVNLASRIEGASEKGQILVGPDTYRATENDFEYRTLPPVILKGKAEPVPVYEV